MQLLEQDKPAFKQWLLPKLANRSEAEPEVLADYVAELFGAEGSKDEIKRNSREQLADFLDDYTHTFVDEVATGIEQKSWTVKAPTEKTKQGRGKGKAKEPTRLAAQPTITPPTAPKAVTATAAAASSSTARPAKSTLAPDAPVFVPQAQAVAGASPGGPPSSLSNDTLIPTGPRADRIKGAQRSQAQSGKTVSGRQNQSKKRKLHERDTSQSRNSGSERAAENAAGERPRKQLARRGGPRANLAAATTTQSGLSLNAGPFTPFAGQPPPPLPQFPPPGPLNPFGFLASVSAMMSQVYSGQGISARIPNMSKAKCSDYETKGICKLGTFCPYDHDEAVVVPADPQYDPNNSSLAMQPHLNGRQTNKGLHGNPSGFQRRERTRAPISQPGPSRGSDDTVVVEQIPEDHFTEQHVRNFFSQFGAIVDAQMQSYKRLAIVKFSDHPAAQRAYDSPKVIFDNRFVKVSWYKPEHLPQSNRTNGITAQLPAQGDVPEIYDEDEDTVDLEGFSKQQAQIQKEWEEKCRKAEEAAARYNMLDAQAKAKEEQLNKLRAKIQKKERAKGVQLINQKDQRAPAIDLAKLQSEAAGLFAHAGSNTPINSGRGSSFRGGFRGRGGTRGGRGGVVRLDNRPRRLAVAGVEAGSEKERALKQYLLNAKGCNGVQPHAERADTLVVGFEQRYQAEMFLNEASRIPSISVADLSWISNDVTVVQQSIESDELVELKHDTDDEMSDGQVESKAEVDLDVADDTDQWL